MSEELRFHIDAVRGDLVAAACRRRRPCGARASNSATSTPSRTIAAKRAGCASSTRCSGTRMPSGCCAGRRVHRHGAGYAGALPGRQPHHLRRRRLGAAAPAAIPGRRPTDERVQQLPEGERAERRRLADELLRAPRQNRRLSHVAAWRDGTSIVGETGATERIPTTRVSPEFFETLGMPPIIGRGFTEAETRTGTDRVAVLTDAFWRQRLSADPNVLGRSLRVNGGSITIVGVLPPEFRFLSSTRQGLLPAGVDPDERSPKERHSGNSDMIARLAPGVSVSAAQSEIDAHNTALERNDPEGKAMAEAGFRSIVMPLHADHVAAVRPVLLLVQAGALVLLTIGAVNLANLLLIRASARRRERAVRQATRRDSRPHRGRSADRNLWC